MCSSTHQSDKPVLFFLCQLIVSSMVFEYWTGQVLIKSNTAWKKELGGLVGCKVGDRCSRVFMLTVHPCHMAQLCMCSYAPLNFSNLYWIMVICFSWMHLASTYKGWMLSILVLHVLLLAVEIVYVTVLCMLLLNGHLCTSIDFPIGWLLSTNLSLGWFLLISVCLYV